MHVRADRLRAPEPEPAPSLHGRDPTVELLLRLQGSVGNSALGRIVSGRTARGVIQRHPLLNSCAASTTNTPTQIDYLRLTNHPPGITAQQTNDLNTLALIVIDAVEHIRRRQAVILALEHGGMAGPLNAYLAGASLGGFLVGSYDENKPWVRSSHSGGVVDPLLPQNPYDTTLAPGAAGPGAGAPGGPPASAAGPGATLSGQANWDWLQASGTPHTTNVNPNFVASYFEVTLTGPLGAGRLCFDPFNYTWFLSSHYAAQYPLNNVPTAQSHPQYQRTINSINNANFAANPHRLQAFFDNLWVGMRTAKL